MGVAKGAPMSRLTTIFGGEVVPKTSGTTTSTSQFTTASLVDRTFGQLVPGDVLYPEKLCVVKVAPTNLGKDFLAVEGVDITTQRARTIAGQAAKICKVWPMQQVVPTLPSADIAAPRDVNLSLSTTLSLARFGLQLFTTFRPRGTRKGGGRR